VGAWPPIAAHPALVSCRPRVCTAGFVDLASSSLFWIWPPPLFCGSGYPPVSTPWLHSTCGNITTRLAACRWASASRGASCSPSSPSLTTTQLTSPCRCAAPLHSPPPNQPVFQRPTYLMVDMLQCHSSLIVYYVLRVSELIRVSPQSYLSQHEAATSSMGQMQLHVPCCVAEACLAGRRVQLPHASCPSPPALPIGACRPATLALYPSSPSGMSCPQHHCRTPAHERAGAHVSLHHHQWQHGHWPQQASYPPLNTAEAFNVLGTTKLPHGCSYVYSCGCTPRWATAA
jgi:hypothetical protein